jgi:hypothetical protein
MVDLVKEQHHIHAKTQKEGSKQVNTFRGTEVETRATHASRHTNYNTTVKIKMEGWHMGS